MATADRLIRLPSSGGGGVEQPVLPARGPFAFGGLSGPDPVSGPTVRSASRGSDVRLVVERP